MAQNIPVIVENGVIKPLRKIKKTGRWRGELILLEKIPSHSPEAVQQLRDKINQIFEHNFPDLKFDPTLLSLIGINYAPGSIPKEDKLLVMEHLEEKYGSP